MSKSFNTFEYVNGAIEAGFTRQQAEYQAKSIERLVEDELVTKTFLRNELEKLEYRLLIKLGSLMITGMTVLGFILKF